MEAIKSLSWITESFSISELLLYIVLTFTSLVIVKQFYVEYKRSPGPWGIPILGFFPFLQKTDPHIQLINLAKKYGDAYLLTLFGKRYLHISSNKAFREVYQTKGDCFLERPQDFSLMEYIFGGGLAFKDGEEWKVLRKTLVQGMRELGIGAKEQMKGPLIEALQATVKTLKESKSQPFNISELLKIQCTEVTRRLFLGENVTFETAQKLNEAYVTAIMPMLDRLSMLLGNIAKYLLLIWIPGFKEMVKAKKELEVTLYEILENHKKNFDPESPQDFIDIYLRDKKLREDKGDPQAKYFTDDVLIRSLIQIYGDGGVSIGFIVTEFLNRLAHREDIQDELFQEISAEIGTDRLPTYEDRLKLPLMTSVIKELERTNRIVQVLTSLLCTKDTTVSGVFVPKGTVTLLNFYAIHHDPSVYKDPETFNPKRFLPDEKTKRPVEELPFLFGLGKRACAGESLVATETFMFLTTILQRFIIRLADPEKEKDKAVGDEFKESMIIAVPRDGTY